MSRVGRRISALRHNLLTRFIVLVITVTALSISALLALLITVRTSDHLGKSNGASPILPHFVARMAAFIIFLCLPFAIVWLASRLVTRPLKRFNEVIKTLQTSDYKVEIPRSKITEFDRVFDSFNELIERLRTEEELRKDLISDTSHELNTPLAALIGQLTAMQEGKLPMDVEHIGVLKGQAERLADLVAQLDAYARARMPATEKVERISVRQVCKRTIDEIALPLQEKHVVVAIVAGKEATVAGSPKALQQILMNLLQNTLRYAEASEVTITVDSKGLTYVDNGKGVPDASLPHLFERFYRVDKSRSRETGGLGLGLAIVQELTQQQGWKINTYAAHPGLAFRITF